MIRISKFLFVLVSIVMTYNAGQAQTSILPDISDVYVEKLIAVAKANYPHVKSNQNRIDMAKGNISRAKASYFEAFTFSYIYQPQNFSTINVTNPSQSYFNGIQAGLFFNLGTFLERPYVINEAKKNFLIAGNDQAEYFLTLADDVKKRYYLYIQSLANVKLQTQASLDAADLFESIKHKFEKGEETYENYNRAQSSLTNNYQYKIQAETNMLITKADLEQLLGQKLETIK